MYSLVTEYLRNLPQIEANREPPKRAIESIGENIVIPTYMMIEQTMLSTA